jgi:hypothetical protein
MGPLKAAVPGEARVLRPILLLMWRIRAAVPVLVPLMACTGWRQLAKHNHVGPLILPGRGPFASLAWQHRRKIVRNFVQPC